MFDTRAVRAEAAQSDEAVDAGAERALRLARLAKVVDQVRPLVLAREHTLPLAEPFTGLFSDGALQRGITLTVDGLGAASVTLALVAPVVAAGSWVAFVDLPDLNLGAAAEAGVALERVACIRSGDQWASAVAALLGAFDLVVVGMHRRVRAGDVRRLGARARERGSVLVALRGGCGGAAVWPDAPDVGLVASTSQWSGLGVGHGHLRARTLTVRAEGRRGFSRPRQVQVTLPASVLSLSPVLEHRAFEHRLRGETSKEPVIARVG